MRGHFELEFFKKQIEYGSFFTDPKNDYTKKEEVSLIFLLDDVPSTTIRSLNISNYEPVRLYFSGDGYRAFMWISSYCELIKEEKCKPASIVFLGYREYKDWINYFTDFFTIQKRSIEGQSIQNATEKENNSYLLDVYEEIKSIAKSKRIPVKRIIKR